MRNELGAGLVLTLVLGLVLLSTNGGAPGIRAASASSVPIPTVAVDPPVIQDLSIAQGAVVTFSVNLTGAPAINGFNIVLSYDPSVLNGTGFSGGDKRTDFTNNVLAATGKSVVTLADCVDNVGICPSAGTGGVVQIAQTILGGLTSDSTSGLLFKVSFIVKGGFSQIHIMSAFLSNGSVSLPVPSPTKVDGYFSNTDCPHGSGTPCMPPVAAFAWSPPTPLVGESVVFDASQSHGPGPGSNITSYFWNWGQYAQMVFNATVDHVFSQPCNCSVSLTVTDSDGIEWTATSIVDVAAQGAFTLSLSPNGVTIPQGSSADVSVLLSGANANQTVELTFDNFGSGIQVSFTPRTMMLQPSQTSVSQVSIIVPLSMPVGVYSINVIAIGTSTTHSTLLYVTVPVHVDPDFDIGIFNLPPRLQVAAGSSVSVELELTSHASFVGTVSLSGTVSPSVSHGPTLSFPQTDVQLAGIATPRVIVSTTPNTPPGQYILNVTGASGRLYHSVAFTLTVFQPPTLILTPSSGVVGTKITAQASGFTDTSGNPFEFVRPILVSFDGNLVGEIFVSNSSFQFTFNVPLSQPGPHQVNALDLFNGAETRANATFQVLSSPVGLDVKLDAGSIYFPGEKAVLYASVSQAGVPLGLSSLQVQITLVKPDGTSISLTPSSVLTGTFTASYAVPVAGSTGTYTVLVHVKAQDGSEASTLKTFEVKPTWLQAQGPKLASAALLVGGIGLVAFSWRKANPRRKAEEPFVPALTQTACTSSGVPTSGGFSIVA